MIFEILDQKQKTSRDFQVAKEQCMVRDILRIDTSKVTEFQQKFLEAFKAKHADIFNEINDSGNFSDESDKKIGEFLTDFCQNFS